MKLISEQDFKSIQKELKSHEYRRDQQMQLSRDIITKSKEIIYALHRDDFKIADQAVKDIKRQLKDLPETSDDSAMVNVAWQEYVEAMTYYVFLKERRLATRKDLGVKTLPYLTGLCDLTGELVRKGIKAVIEDKRELFHQIKQLVEDIYGEFSFLELRENELRKKADSIKYNLRKLEDVAYDIKMQGKIVDE